MRKYLEPIIHLLLWGLGYYMLSILSTSAGSFKQGEEPYRAAVLFGTLVNMVIFYTTAFFLVPRMLRLKKRMTFIISLIIGFLGVCLLESYIDYSFVASFFPSNEASFLEHALQNCLTGFIVLLASLSYALFNNWVENEKLKRVLLEEKLSTEMAFLKSKINPHFLFNVLNSFYAKTLKHNVPELSDGLLKLAELTRYMVYETNEDKVLLEREIRHLKNFIEVYQLRIAEEDDVIMNFDIIGDIYSVIICPMLLIPFVENAIKHGINPQERSEINILIEIKQQTLYFKVTNPIAKITNGIVDDSSGFGLDNLKTRLAILYPNTHTIETRTESGTFIAELCLQLN
ncbi:sensor histidine kinase [Tenacibaculum retecalamus]|uniref:sensor histidine kinase n=1 Tax=Tenacibaculum retecalamus TaxID=3018315 RepID=UPI0023D8E7F4|nr:histidine kinase [Tenacibaculum retecalamus]WBX70104.1 histidine kinase [Tenacibaculum retecalamus]